MIKLSPPVQLTNTLAAAQECFDEIWNEAKHSQAGTCSQFIAVETQWRQRNLQYILGRGEPNAVGASPFARRSSAAAPKEVGDLMFDRYRSGSSTDKAIVSHANRVSVGYCPYCGLYLRRKPHSANPDRDHIRPRSLFPEFSLMRLNLVVACDDCNDAKLDQDVDDNGDWLFIHPYFDDFLDSSILVSDISANNGSPVIDFMLCSNLDSAVLRRLKRHVKTLDLFKRYRDDPLRNAVQILEAHQGHIVAGSADVALVRRLLAEQGKREIASRPNDPVGAILIGLSNTQDLELLLRAPRTLIPPVPAAQTVGGTP